MCLSSVNKNRILRLISALIVAGGFVLTQNQKRITSIETLNQFGTEKYLCLVFVLFILLSVFCAGFRKICGISSDEIFFLVTLVSYGFLIALNTENIYYICMIGFFLILAVRYLYQNPYSFLYQLNLSSGKMTRYVILLSVFTLVYLGSLAVLRIFLFKPVTFDFGIFVQMFHYLKETLIPYTTCERFKLLSHFSIHFSPFFYCILPFYALFPSPVTLILVQLTAVLSGVIPLYLMCKRRKLKTVVCFALCFAYLLYPAFRGGLFYDFHENKFLPPLILWLLYFLESEKKYSRKLPGIILFTLLIVSVKEDAPIYTACIGFFELVDQKDWKGKLTGFFILAFSVIYFFVVFHFMGIYGDAGNSITSLGRYANLMVTDYDGIAGLVMNILKDPAYTISQLLDAEKAEFLLWMFVPVMFLPLYTRKLSRYILLIPLVLLNLLSDYQYQHSIYYQYTYASGTLVIYLTYLELSSFRGNRARRFSAYIIILSFLLSTASISSRNTYYSEYKTNGDIRGEVHKLLERIPEDASVSATTTYVPPLAQRDEIHKYTTGDTTDYIVLSVEGKNGEIYRPAAQNYLENGYHLFGEVDDIVIVLEKDK